MCVWVYKVVKVFYFNYLDYFNLNVNFFIFNYKTIDLINRRIEDNQFK